MNNKIQYLGAGSTIFNFGKQIAKRIINPIEKGVVKKELLKSVNGSFNKKVTGIYGSKSLESNLNFANDLISRSNTSKVLPKEMLDAAKKEINSKVSKDTSQTQIANIVDAALNKQLQQYKSSMNNLSYFISDPLNFLKHKYGAFKEVKYDYNFGDAANGVYRATEKSVKNSVGKIAKKAAIGAGVTGAAIYGVNKLTEYELDKPKLKTPNKNQQQTMITQQPQEDYGQQYSNEYQDDSSNYPDGAQDNFDIQDSYSNIKLPKKKNNLQLNSNNLDPDIKKLLNKTNTNNNNYFNYTKDNSIINYLSLYHGLYNNIK